MDQYSCEWPLLPHGLRNRSKDSRTEMIAKDRESDCFRLAQCKDFTLTERRRYTVVQTRK